MTIIANWTAIQGLGHIVSNITDYTQCPQKSDILANSAAFVVGTYDNNQLVKLSDITLGGLAEQYDYIGYSALTEDQSSDMREAYNSDITGKLYKFGGVYYSNYQYSIIADNGTYCIEKGAEGYPYYSDSIFINIGGGW